MKTGKTHKLQTNKTNYMSDEAFAELKEAMADALAFEHSKRRDLKITRIKAPPTQDNVIQGDCSDPDGGPPYKERL